MQSPRKRKHTNRSRSSSAEHSYADSSIKKVKKEKKKKKKEKKKKKKSKKSENRKTKSPKSPTDSASNDPHLMSSWSIEYTARWTEAMAGPLPAQQLQKQMVTGKTLSALLSHEQLGQYFDIPQALASLLFRAIQGQLMREEAAKEADKPLKRSRKEKYSYGEASASGVVDSSACLGGFKRKLISLC